MLSDSLQVGYPGLRFSVTEDEQQMLKLPNLWHQHRHKPSQQGERREVPCRRKKLA